MPMDHERTLRQVVGGLHRTGTALIKRGTAMGPLVPVLFLVPVLAAVAWLFKDTAVIQGVPVFTALSFLGIVGIIVHYLWHYTSYAKHDPDRLQSEEYRSQMQQLQIAAKGLPEPLPAHVLEDPIPNPIHPDDGMIDDSRTEPTNQQEDDLPTEPTNRS